MEQVCALSQPIYLEEELRCPKQANVKQNSKTNPPETALRFTKILFWFYSNYGSEEMLQGPFSDADDKWLTDKKNGEGDRL